MAAAVWDTLLDVAVGYEVSSWCPLLSGALQKWRDHCAQKWCERTMTRWHSLRQWKRNMDTGRCSKQERFAVSKGGGDDGATFLSSAIKLLDDALDALVERPAPS